VDDILRGSGAAPDDCVLVKIARLEQALAANPTKGAQP